MVTKTVWKAGALEPLKIILDVLNPRVEIDKNATQDQLRIKLLELEDVLDLARNIEKNHGLFYGERIITTSISGKQIVLEGNRRVAACQMLLQPSLVPSSYKTRFPVATAITRANLRKILVDIAPSRAAAEPILTKRHTEQGAKPWSPVAKMRRAVRLLDNNSVEAVAQILGTSIAQVNKLIQPYQLLKYAINLNVWTVDERKILAGEKLTTNPYTRFFTLAKTKQILQTHFDENKNIISALPASVFKLQMARIARDFLLPDPANQNRPRCTTRTNPEEYFASFVKSTEGQASVKKASKLKKDEKTQVNNKPEINPVKADLLVSKKPPYYVQGSKLYRFSYKDQDHVALATFIRDQGYPWLLSYDDHPRIRELYENTQVQPIYLDYKVRSSKTAQELLISNLEIPPPVYTETKHLQELEEVVFANQ